MKLVLRVSLFIDYQNVYHGARRIFHQSDAHNSFGQVSPRELGEFLCRRRPSGSDSDERQLQGVRVYRGTPATEWSRGTLQRYANTLHSGEPV